LFHLIPPIGVSGCHANESVRSGESGQKFDERAPWWPDKPLSRRGACPTAAPSQRRAIKNNKLIALIAIFSIIPIFYLSARVFLIKPALFLKTDMRPPLRNLWARDPNRGYKPRTPDGADE
jgi:hypothetical protein